MGLDITAYRKLKAAPDEWWDDDIEDVSEDHWHEATSLRPNPDFPGREEGIPAAKIFTYEEEMRFRAGSYSGYYKWREWLAKLAGYPLITEDFFGTPEESYSAGCLEVDKGPFSELIIFSDCDGVIGPVVAKKLLKDFEEWDERAREADTARDSYFYRLYKKWREAFEMAANDGAIAFH